MTVKIIQPFHVYLSNANRMTILNKIDNIIENGAFVLNKHTDELESRIAEYLGLSNTKLVSSGTVALEAVFEYLAIKGHRSVAVQSNTNFATVSSILRAGLRPIFIDCDLDGQISYSDLVSKHSHFRFDAVAIVHIGGYLSNDLQAILDFVKQENLFCIEDCAHAHGTTRDGSAAGSFGDASILSFFPTKLVNGSEGGAVCTNDKDLSEFVHKWRNQGKDGTYGNWHTVLGGSYRMPEINCVIALEYYGVLQSEIRVRQKIFNLITAEVDGICFTTPRSGDTTSFYKMICRIDGVNGSIVEQFLKDRGINCGGGVYRSPCSDQPVFSTVVDGRTNLIGTAKFCGEHFCPPLHSGLQTDDVSRIIQGLQEAVMELKNDR
jgi:perosamine synthetase